MEIAQAARKQEDAGAQNSRQHCVENRITCLLEGPTQTDTLRHTDRQTHADTQTDRHTQTHRQTDTRRHTQTHADTRTHTIAKCSRFVAELREKIQ